MNYFKSIENILLSDSVDDKFEKFYAFYNNFKENKITFEQNHKTIKIRKPSYSSFCKIIPPSKVRKRKNFNTDEGKINLLHTIAHIEYSAVDLALDAAYRFQNMPLEYYSDWLEVVDDEIRHFKMLQELMRNFKVEYGDIPVHTNLFDIMIKTDSLVDRMAIVPRYHEANGLEQNPKIMEKLKSNPDDFNLKFLKALDIILEEEITHVHKGDKWFKYECDRLNLNAEEKYLKLLDIYYPGVSSKRLDLNCEARKKAGFSCAELKRLSNC